MTDGQTLYLILSLVYLSDCFVWIGRRSVAFSSPWLLNWRVAFSDQFLSNSRGSLFFLNPLPPLGTVHLCHTYPVALSPEGICNRTLSTLRGIGGPPDAAACFAYESVTSVAADGAHLILNGKRFAKCGGAQQARELSALVSRVSRENMEGRERLVREFIRNRLNPDAIRERMNAVASRAAELRLSALLLFLFLCVAAPLLVHTAGLGRMIIPIAAATFAASTYISARYYRAHRYLYAGARLDRIMTAAAMALCPPAAIRAVDRLTAEALSEYHPILVASMLPGEESGSLIRLLIQDLKHPLRCESPDEGSREIARWFSQTLMEECLRFVEARGMNEVLLPPKSEARQEGCVAYCPRCGSQYRTAGRECPDCPGVELLPFPVSGGL